jgi:SAM-dependent methyltransferase
MKRTGIFPKSSSSFKYKDSYNISGEILTEKHHTQYGNCWGLGKDYFNFLKERIKKDDKILDFGCGTLRLGIHLIQFLNSGRYFGIDSDQESIDICEKYEIPLNDLNKKNATFAYNDEFILPDIKFDVIFAAAVFIHLPKKSFEIFLENLKFKKGSKLYLTHNISCYKSNKKYFIEKYNLKLINSWKGLRGYFVKKIPNIYEFIFE